MCGTLSTSLIDEYNFKIIDDYKMFQMLRLRTCKVKVHVPPCVILVINDNPYGLMFALSYICRTYP
jgi:hypothetical protein